MKLDINYGRDQEGGVDELLEELKNEGYVLNYKKEYGVISTVYYQISFSSEYGIYIFGRKSTDLLNYLYKSLNKQTKDE